MSLSGAWNIARLTRAERECTSEIDYCAATTANEVSDMSDQVQTTRSTLNVKDAVRVAKAYLADLLAEEGISNLGLEEVDHDGIEGVWHVTLGFSRPWNTITNTLTALTGAASPRRTYKVLKVSDIDG